jgi:hypothetical protein
MVQPLATSAVVLAVVAHGCEGNRFYFGVGLSFYNRIHNPFLRRIQAAVRR